MSNKQSIKYMNTLTHDVAYPVINGFCMITHLNDKNERVVEHNGFKNLKAEDIDAFRRIADMLEVMYKLKGDE